jgi:hypothetical protein
MAWDDFGEVLDPALREEAVLAALGRGHRPTALKALGRMVARFPASERHLALHGLSRLADNTPEEALSRVLAALSRKRPQRAANPPSAVGRKKRKRAPQLTPADKRSFRPLEKVLTSREYLQVERLEPLAKRLTSAAAARAADVVREIEAPWRQLPAMMALASAPKLGTADREDLVAKALELNGYELSDGRDARRLAKVLKPVCHGEAWAERLAAFFDAWRGERGPFLEIVEAFAPLLFRLGGSELCAAVAEKLGAPLPVPEFARPWTNAVRMTVEA